MHSFLYIILYIKQFDPVGQKLEDAVGEWVHEIPS